MIIENHAQVTDAVIDALQRTENPRLKQVLASLVRHLHAFARDVRLTEEEFDAAITLVTALGQQTTASHNETRLIAGSLGLSSLVCLLNNGDDGQTETSANLLGPFWRQGAPPTPEWRLDPALAHPWQSDVLHGSCCRSAIYADRRRRGRCLAGLDVGPLREPGPRAGRDEPAWPFHHRCGRQFRVP